jgi:hypothetical protein
VGVVTAVLLAAYLISSLVHLNQSERVSLGGLDDEPEFADSDDDTA